MRKLTRIGPHPVTLSRYVAHHAVTRWQRQRLRRSYARLVTSAPTNAALHFPGLDLPAADDLPPPLVEAAERIRVEAETILDHRVDLLGSGPVWLGDEIDWHRDFKSGYRWERVFYQDVKVTRLDDASDPKVPWELSRGHQLLTLARAARLFEDDRFADELARQMHAWIEENPAGSGINWTNSMEVAIRATNWVWAVRTFEAWRPFDPSLRKLVAITLHAHAGHIARNLEGTPYLRSNHYLSDILGLLVLGATLGEDPAIQRCFDMAHRAFEREITRQVHDDGVGFEASLPYHGLALEIFALANEVARWRSRPFSRRYVARLERMLLASRMLRHPDGRLPQIGDGDSGRILPAGFARPATIDHVLWLGASTVDRDRPTSEMPNEEVAWTFGIGAWRAASKLPVAQPPESTAFRRGGFFAFRNDSVHAVVRCGDVGQNGNGGHAHNDALSFELSYMTPFVVDSGTYLYTADAQARNAYRSTRAHNTVEVDAQEINPLESTELFTLRQVAHPRAELWESNAVATRLIASHDGYRRLTSPVTHRRTFTLDHATGTFDIVDELIGTGQHDAAVFLHLAPNALVTRITPERYDLRISENAVSLIFAGLGEITLDEGWISNQFGKQERAPRLTAHVRGDLPLRFGFSFVPTTDSKAFEDRLSGTSRR